MSTTRSGRVAGGEAVYCLRCGRRALRVMGSLDPAHPIVRCAWTDSDGYHHGCGRLPGTYDENEAHGAAYIVHVDKVTGMHARHIAKGRPSPDCRECDKEPPAPPDNTHGWEQFNTRHRLLAHLEFRHHVRYSWTDSARLPIADFLARHRELHGLPPGS